MASDKGVLALERPSTRLVMPYGGPLMSGTIPPTRFAARQVVSGDEGGDTGSGNGGKEKGTPGGAAAAAGTGVAVAVHSSSSTPFLSLSLSLSSGAASEISPFPLCARTFSLKEDDGTAGGAAALRPAP